MEEMKVKSWEYSRLEMSVDVFRGRKMLLVDAYGLAFLPKLCEILYTAAVCGKSGNISHAPHLELTLKVLVATIDALGHFETAYLQAQCEGMGEVGSARYEPALLPPCPSIRVLSYSNCQRSSRSMSK